MKVLISGSSRGIGLKIVEKFIACGHFVVGFDIAETQFLHENYRHYIVDVTSEELPDLGNFDIVISNAGVQTQSIKDIEVNLIGAMNFVEKYAFNDDIKSVLIVSSASASTGAEFKEYCASKGGLLSYTKNVALRLAPYKATANSLSPGGVITPMNEHILSSEKLYKKVLDETLLGKWATAEEMAEFAYFLTVVNQSMTGQDVFVDNGEALKSNFIW